MRSALVSLLVTSYFAFTARADVLEAQYEILRKLFSDLPINSEVRPPSKINSEVRAALHNLTPYYSAAGVNIQYFGKSANLSGDPVVVTVTVYVLDVTDFNDDNQEFTINMYLRQHWNDPRLRYSSTEQRLEHVFITDPNLIWVPDLFVLNEKKGRVSDVIARNAMIRIKRNGDIVYSTRLSLTLACAMDHTKFPMDRQRCSVLLESYAHQTKDVVLLWREIEPVEFNHKLTTKPFKLLGYGYDYCPSRTSTGVYSCVRLEVLVERTGFARSLLQIYAPLLILVFLSHLTLWRLGELFSRLCAACLVLLMTVLTASYVASQAPLSRDFTALEHWAATCTVLVTLPVITLVLAAVLDKCKAGHEDSGDANNVKTKNGEPRSSSRLTRCLPQSAGAFIELIVALLFPLLLFFLVLSHRATWPDTLGLSTTKKFIL